jgi:signal peptidase II
MILYGLIGLIGGVIFLIELLIKNYLRTYHAFESIPIIKNIFHITVVFNTGAAFGILKGKTSFLIYLGLVFMLVFFTALKKEKDKNLIVFISYGLILGGTISNLFDRIFFGYVVDYIDLRIWPVFNLADSAITVGVILLILNYLKNKNDKIINS